jgi:DNA-binding YbaB/EbfC family protein
VNVFEGLSGLGSLLKQAQEISGRMKGLNDELRGRRASGTSGGGMVEVEVNGLLEVLRVRVDPQLLAQTDRELLEDLILTAVNQALAKGKELHAEALKAITGSVDVSGLQETLGKFLGQSGPTTS